MLNALEMSGFSLQVHLIAWLEVSAFIRGSMVSQYANMKQSREQCKAKAIERGQAQRYQRKQSARQKATAEQKTKALEAAQARIRELEAQLHEVTTRPKVEVVHFALQLFLEARIGFRAVSRVLTLLAWALDIKKAPCPQSVINLVMRLAIVRIDSARYLHGLPLPQVPFCNGLISMYWPGHGEDFSCFDLRCPSSSTPSRCAVLSPGSLYWGQRRRELDGRGDC